MRRSAGQTVRIQAARAQTLSTQTVPMPLPEQTPPDAASSAELEACLGADVGAGPCEFLLTASEEERRAWQLVARTLSTLLASHGHHAGQVVPPLTMPTPSTLLSGAEPPTTLEQLVYLLAGALLQLVLQGEAEAEQRRAGKMARVATRVAADVAANVARAIAGQVTHAALGSVRVGTPRAEWYAVLPHATPSVPVRGATLTARQREVLTLLYQGQRPAAIAEQLMMQVETVRTHIRNASRRLGASGGMRAAVAARALGLLFPA